MLFDLIRLSLLERSQLDAFEPRASSGTILNREEWLRHILSERIEFVHRKKRFVFVPLVQDGLIGGGIGRSRVSLENEPPEAGYEPVEREFWKAATFLLDPRTHADGQKIAMERVPDVGEPLAVVKSLAAHLNEVRPSPYTVEVGLISEERDFWEFVQAHEGQITAASFEFIAPNMFGMSTDYDAEMKDLQQEEGVEQASLTLRSSEGLRLRTPRVEQAMRYISRGTGRVRARTRKGGSYNSDRSAQQVYVDEPDGRKRRAPLIERIRAAIKIVFET